MQTIRTYVDSKVKRESYKEIVASAVPGRFRNKKHLMALSLEWITLVKKFPNVISIHQHTTPRPHCPTSTTFLQGSKKYIYTAQVSSERITRINLPACKDYCVPGCDNM